MSKHTPGPWLVSPDGNVVSGQAGIVERIAVSIFCSKERRDANARLIAAAPQMLDALEAIIKRFQPEQHDAAGCMFKNCELCKAIAAIKAAKGGSMSITPRTDEREFAAIDLKPSARVVYASFARQLEIELTDKDKQLADARAEIESLKKERTMSAIHGQCEMEENDNEFILLRRELEQTRATLATAEAEIRGAIKLCGEYAINAKEGLYASLALSIGRLKYQVECELAHKKKLSVFANSGIAANENLFDQLTEARAEIERLKSEHEDSLRRAKDNAVSLSGTVTEYAGELLVKDRRLAEARAEIERLKKQNLDRASATLWAIMRHAFMDGAFKGYQHDTEERLRIQYFNEWCQKNYPEAVDEAITQMRLIEQMREALRLADDLIDEYAADYEHRDNIDEIREEIKATLSAAERMKK